MYMYTGIYRNPYTLRDYIRLYCLFLYVYLVVFRYIHASYRNNVSCKSDDYICCIRIISALRYLLEVEKST